MKKNILKDKWFFLVAVTLLLYLLWNVIYSSLVRSYCSDYLDIHWLRVAIKNIDKTTSEEKYRQCLHKHGLEK